MAGYTRSSNTPSLDAELYRQQQERQRQQQAQAAKPSRQSPSTTDQIKKAAADYAEKKAEDAAWDYATGASTGTSASNAANWGYSTAPSWWGNAASTGVATDAATGGTVLADGTIVSGVGTDAATGGTILADGSVASGTGGTTTLGAAAPYLGAAAAAYGAYQMGEHWGKRKPGNMAAAGATSGAGVGTMILPGIGTAIGAGVGAIAGAGLGMIKSGREAGHDRRSDFRDALAKGGFAQRTPALGGQIDKSKVKNSTGTFVQLADGSYYDISDEKTGQAHSVLTPEKEWTGQAQGWAMPIAALLVGDTVNQFKLFSDTTAQLTNAMRSNSGDIEGIRANALALFEKLGISKDQAIEQIGEMGKAGRLSPPEVDAYINGLNVLFSGSGYVTNQALSEGLKAQGGPPPLPSAFKGGKTPEGYVPPTQAASGIDPGRNPINITVQQMGPGYIKPKPTAPSISPPPSQPDLTFPFIDQKAQAMANQIAAARKNGMALR